MAGKFASECDQIAWDMSMVGCDLECGDVSYGEGWFGLIMFGETEAATIRAAGAMDTEPAGCIVNEDGQGFVSVDDYGDETALMAAWDECERATSADGED